MHITHHEINNVFYENNPKLRINYACTKELRDLHTPHFAATHIMIIVQVLAVLHNPQRPEHTCSTQQQRTRHRLAHAAARI